jgi:multicomponent Na+:H+ antiporter subunit A
MAWDLNSVSFFSGFNLIEPVLVFLMIGGALTAVSAKSRLTAVAALGFVGYGLALIYLIHGAPDVAITQLVIETLTVVLMVLVIYRLPPFQQFSSRALRWRDGATAVLVALVFASLVLLESAGVSAAPISSYFLENSVPLAHGRNVVNVILVDFRALDTLGEITVIAIAALGVYALLKLKIISKD